MDLQRLEDLYDEATPGPWSFDTDGKAGYGNYHSYENADEWQRLFFTEELGAFRLADIELVSALHAAFPEILKRLRAAEVLVRVLKDQENEDTYRRSWMNAELAFADYEKAIKN